MLRVLLGGFVVAHGLVTGVIWATPNRPDAPFDAGHSWLLDDSRGIATVVALIAATGFLVAGAGFLAHRGWWAPSAVAAGTLAVVLMLLYFDAWLIVGIAISASVAYAGVHAMQEA
jgi:hypothetical protein